MNAIEQTTIFLSRLDSAIDKLTALRRLHDQRRTAIHNALHDPLLALPPEIVGTIFEYVVAEARQHHISGYHQEVYRLAHVCSRWRAITLSWTPLFAYLSLHRSRYRNDLQVEMWMDKTGSEGPLDLHHATFQHAHFIRNHASRLRSLLYHEFSLQVGCRSYERLQVLVMPRKTRVNLFDWNAPALRQLRLFHPIQLPVSIASHLRFLSLFNVYSFKGLYKVLISAEQLEGLQLFDGNFGAPPLNSDQGEERPRGVLNSLQRLRINGCDSMEHFFNYWACPKLQVFYWDSLELWNDDIESFFRYSSHLHTLTFDIKILYSSMVVSPTTPLPPFPELQTIRLLGLLEQPRDIHEFCIRPFLETFERRPRKQYQPSSSSSIGPFLHSDDNSALSPPPSTKIPIRLEIEDSGLLKECRAWYEERVDVVVRILNPDSRLHPEWYLS